MSKIVWCVFIFVTTISSVVLNEVPSNRMNEEQEFQLLRRKRQSTEEIVERCVLPPQPENGFYHIQDIRDTGPNESLKFYLLVSCNEGYGFPNTKSRFDNGTLEVLCADGDWSSQMPKCKRYCKLEPDPTVRYICKAPGKEGYKTCGNDYLMSGTSVKPVCKRDYYSNERLEEMKCLNGSFDYIARCKAECGRIFPHPEDLNELTAGFTVGRAIRRGEAPWHVLIYHNSETPRCGGTIISKSVVISAGYCFSTVEYPSTDYWVIANKIYSNWVDGRDDFNEMQWSKVKEVQVLGGWLPTAPSNIAVVTLTDPFVFNSHVSPICVNFDKEFIKDDDVGKVAGIGIKKQEKKEKTIRLQIVEMAIINQVTCRNTLVYPYFKDFLSSNLTCAGHATAADVSLPLIGSGLAIARNESGIQRYYLQGPALLEYGCDENLCVNNFTRYMSFGNVSVYEDVLKYYI